jgi:ribonuclease VapC
VIVDSSALVAILKQEAGFKRLIRAFVRQRPSSMSVANWLETSVVVSRYEDRRLENDFDQLVSVLSLRLEPVTESQVKIARAAYRDFGKGSGHPAQLNFGDCFAYALAYERGEPLLCVGDDFASTDLELVNLEEIDEAEDD